MRKSERAKQID